MDRRGALLADDPDDGMRARYAESWARTGLLALAVELAGCGGAARPAPALAAQPAAAYVPVPQPPPPARVEIAPEAPREDAVWVGREWDFRFRRWIWTYGRWVVPPAGAAYARWSLERDDKGELKFAPGAWRDAQGEVVESPPPLVVATARENAVTERDGTQQRVGPNKVPPPPKPPDAP